MELRANRQGTGRKPDAKELPKKLLKQEVSILNPGHAPWKLLADWGRWSNLFSCISSSLFTCSKP